MSEGNIIWIPLDGDMITEKAVKPPSLERLQQYVGGFVEIVSVFVGAERRQMIVNEEGSLVMLPVNPWATSIYHCHSIAVKGEIPRPLIHGNAVLLINLQLD